MTNRFLRISRVSLSALAAVLLASSAQATLIDFEDLAEGEGLSAQYAGLGVTFSGSNVVRTVPNYNFGSFPTHSGINAIGSPTTGLFGAVFASLVTSVGLWVASGNTTVSFTAYDINGATVATTTLAGTLGQTKFLSLAGLGISSVLLDGQAGRLVVDDFEFAPDFVAVPEPATLAILAAGVALLGAGSRRRPELRRAA